MLKKMETAKKKAEAVVDTVDISEREKMSQLKRYGCSNRQDKAVFMSWCSVRLASWLALLCSQTMNERSSVVWCPLTASTRRRAWGRRRRGR